MKWKGGFFVESVAEKNSHGFHGLTRIAAAAALLLAAALSMQTGCRQRGGTDNLLAGIDRSLALAARFLVAGQSPDGAWRSEQYGGLKDGPSLTPPILKFL